MIILLIIQANKTFKAKKSSKIMIIYNLMIIGV